MRVLLPAYDSRWAGLALIDDRDDCFAVGEVNQQALFRRVAAVVHHGGAGTTTTAARAGAPQLVIPQAAAGKGRQWPREPRGIAGPGPRTGPRTREPANPGGGKRPQIGADT